VSFTNGRTTVAFARALETGHNPVPLHPQPFPQEMPALVLWATGSGPIADCTAVPSYHFSDRGMLGINWLHPELVLEDTLRC
jgi:hypothetical protein